MNTQTYVSSILQVYKDCEIVSRETDECVPKSDVKQWKTLTTKYVVVKYNIFLMALHRRTWQFLIRVQIILFYDPRELDNN